MTSPSRRTLLKSGAVATGLLWSAPVVTSAGRVAAQSTPAQATMSSCEATSDCDGLGEVAVGPEGTLSGVRACIQPAVAGVSLRLEILVNGSGADVRTATTQADGCAAFADVDVSTTGAEDDDSLTLRFTFTSPGAGEGTCEREFLVDEFCDLL